MLQLNEHVFRVLSGSCHIYTRVDALHVYIRHIKALYRIAKGNMCESLGRTPFFSPSFLHSNIRVSSSYDDFSLTYRCTLNRICI